MSDVQVFGTNIAETFHEFLSYIWSNVGDVSVPLLEKNCFDLAAEYRASGRPAYDCAVNFIEWQTVKAAGTGFALGLPGGLAAFATIPTEMATVTYLQLRAVAVIAILFGWDLKSDRVKTIAMLSLLGASAGEVLQQFGVQVGTKMAAVALSRIPGAVFIEINKAVGFRLITKAGQRGIINMPMAIPILGAFIGASINGFVTYEVAHTALGFLKDGPAAENPDYPPSTEEQVIA
jgi:uncharacterized protein (DUF697 family)